MPNLKLVLTIAVVSAITTTAMQHLAARQGWPVLFGQRVAFWGAVAVVSVVSQFALEAITQRFPVPGLAQFTAFAHAGADH